MGEQEARKVLGLVFDVEEFAVFDGPGIRTVVFLKGCPLRCLWCHNPEGLEMRPERMFSRDLCRHCGRCQAVCAHSPCQACGRCAEVCPAQCIRIAGAWKTAGEIAGEIGRHAEILADSGGGLTFSGGEALLQPQFVLAVRALLPNVHMAVETCGHVEQAVFERVVRQMDLVLFDIKHTDAQLHRKYTGAGNALIRRNLDRLMRMEVPFIARLPMIPGVNDTAAHLETAARWLEAARCLVRVELLPYNRAAGAKYALLGKAYQPAFDTDREPWMDREPFTSKGMECVIL